MLFRCAAIVTVILLSSYAFADANKEKPGHIDHPDHIPHNGGKNPIKKIGGDDIVFPRKRKKGEEGEGS